MEQEEIIIAVYLMLEAGYNRLLGGRRLRQRGQEPAITDPEVLTIEVIGELFGQNGDRAIWRYTKAHWSAWFPRLGAYKTFAKHCANLARVKQQLVGALFQTGRGDDVHITDGLPLPVCRAVRASRCRSLKGDCAWSYCAAKDMYYYGLKAHVLMALSGTISACCVAPANIDERAALMDTTAGIAGLVIGDKGLLDKRLQAELAALCGIDLETPLRENMEDKRPKAFVKQLCAVRKRIETALSVLTEHFAIARIRAHDLWHYTSKFARKLLAYNFYITLKT